MDSAQPDQPGPAASALLAPGLSQPLKPVAAYIHTVVILLLLLGVSLMTWKSASQLEIPRGPLVTYLPTLIWLWLLFGLVAFGLRRSGTSLKEIFGPMWHSFDDVLMDVVVAVGFWLVALLVLAAAGFLLLGSQHNQMQDATKALQGLAPHGALGIAIWIVLSASAGICEEFVFRGYLQRQFSALTRSITGGVLLSAAVFALGHLYQGAAKAALIGVFGMMFGALAAWRKNLRPGIIAHMWHDIFSGLLLSILTNHAAKSG